MEQFASHFIYLISGLRVINESTTPKTKSCTSGLERSRITCVPPRPVDTGRFSTRRIHLGLFSKSSLFVFELSGSIQMPNFILYFFAESRRPFIPNGSFSLQTCQSPRDDLSLLRGYLFPNQPSSITKSSPPIAENSFIILSIPLWFTLK